jgi:hypothetical protein
LKLLLQFPEPLIEKGTVGKAKLALTVSLLLVVLSPPRPRIQTPPPCESGGGLAGALTNALLCVRKAVFAAFIVAAIADAPDMAPLNVGARSTVIPKASAFTGLQFCACALEDAKPVKMRTPAKNAL